MNLILILFSFLFVSYSVRNVAADVTPLDFAELGFNVLSSFDNPAKIFQAFSKFTSSMTSDGDKNEKTLNKIQGTLTSMNNKLDSITENLQSFRDEIISKLKELRTDEEITSRLDRFFILGETIDRYFDTFRQVSKKNRSKDDLTRFINTVRSLNSGVGVKAILIEMLNALTGNRWSSSGLKVLSDFTIVSTLVCSRGRSQQLIINNLYKALWVAELKGLAMDLFTIKELMKKNPDMKSTLDNTKNDFVERSNEAVKYLKDAMSKSSRELWSCTSNNPQQGVTYEKFRSFMYKVIQPEYNMMQSWERATWFGCREDCTRFSEDSYITCKPWSAYHDCIDYRNMCEGKTYYCGNFDSNIHICHSKDSTFVEDESRHYEYVEGDNGQIYGKKKQGGCNGKLTYHWARSEFWAPCDICVCTCVPPNPKSSYIDLRVVTADVKENKVVVGLRLKKIDDVFHLEIQQGKLLPSGSIDPKTISWKSNPKTNDTGYYHKFSLKDRSVLLDDVEFDSTFVITGVKFAHDDGLLRLEAQGHRFDYKQGKLIVGYYDLHYFEGGTRDLREYDIKDYDLPTNHLNNWFHTVPRQYVKMTISSMKSDVGQSIVPFVDIEPVTSKQPTPLSGVGLFHKSHKNEAAGYLALKILSYDYTPHVKFNA
ncbi:uncharacterized protein LOC106649345 [Trichogramma pretiosum]|uniref:uncharacterized protein LOC106649345 n=1 Tax=Trichogramma pretiosum TaxID=7493 RepID=UPI000C7193C8|nr:uncharacterized protein LOC106649345 [Trichogramma pretiosum]